MPTNEVRRNENTSTNLALGVSDQVKLSDAGFTPSVRDLMSTEVFTLNEDDNLNLLQELMDWQRIRHVPVVSAEGELTGIVTHRDFLRVAISQLAEVSRREVKSVYNGISIKKIMNTEVTVTTPDTKLSTAAKIMRENKFGCLPMVDRAGHLVGIITEADFLKAFEEWDTVFTA